MLSSSNSSALLLVRHSLSSLVMLQSLTRSLSFARMFVKSDFELNITKP